MKNDFEKFGSPTRQGALDLVAAVIVERPDLKDAVFYAPGRGVNSYIIMTETEVFKGVRHDDPESFMQECERLKVLSQSGLSVPTVTTEGKNAAFYGMTRVQGAMLDVPARSLPPVVQDAMAEQIAEFLIACNRILQNHEGLVQRNSVYETIPSQALVLKRIDSDLVHHALGDDYAYCQTQVDDYYARLPKRKMLLAHNDIHGQNILVDPETYRIKSFIDFGVFSEALPENIVHRMFSHEDGDFRKTIADKLIERGVDFTKTDFLQSLLVHKIAMFPYWKDRTLENMDALRKAVAELKEINPPGGKIPAVNQAPCPRC